MNDVCAHTVPAIHTSKILIMCLLEPISIGWLAFFNRFEK